MGGLGLLFLVFILIAPASAQSRPIRLQQKLEAQWQLYSKARQLLLERIQNPDLSLQQKLFSRQEWESILTLHGPMTLTPQDIATLTKSQRERIQQAKERDERDSLIDLDTIRANHEVTKFCAGLPKGGMLHIHPFGTLDRQTADLLLRSLNPPLDINSVFQDINASDGNSELFPLERDWLRAITENARFLTLSPPDQVHFESFLFLPDGKQPFPRFNAVFEFLGFAAPDWASYDKVLLNFAKKAVREHVLYVEFTTGAGPTLFAHLATLEQETGLTIRVNNSFDRTESVEQINQNLTSLLAMKPNKFLVGIDLLDNEAGNSVLEKGQLLYGSVLYADDIGKANLHRTMHAGEIGDIRNPRDAMILGAQRLGHGVNLAKDPVALEYAARIHEPIEINLSSNLRLTDVQSIATHPFLKFLRLGLPVSLSTDDEGIFDTDIDHECELAVRQTDINYAELKEMAFNSVETSFASAADKARLFTTLSDEFAAFEKIYRSGR